MHLLLMVSLLMSFTWVNLYKYEEIDQAVFGQSFLVVREIISSLCYLVFDTKGLSVSQKRYG